MTYLACSVTYMASKKVTAQRNRQSVSTTTAKAVGVKAKKATLTRTSVLALIRAYNATQAKKGAKLVYEDTNLIDAIVKASKVSSLSSASITTSKGDAKARRSHASKVNAITLQASDIIHANKGGEIVHDRPENVIRSRVQELAKVCGLPSDTFYAVRMSPYKKGDSTASIAVVRK